jgi:hypothetical protein
LFGVVPVGPFVVAGGSVVPESRLADALTAPNVEVMALDDITKKAQQFLADEKVQKALKSEKAEGASDKVLDAVAGAASRVTGGKHDEQIRDARNSADKRLGNQ